MMIISVIIPVGMFTIFSFLIEIPCHVDGFSVCYSDENLWFEIEEQAFLIIQVPSEAVKTYLHQQLDDRLQQKGSTIQIRVATEITAWEAQQEHHADIFYIQESQAAMIYQNLVTWNPIIVSTLNLKGIEHFGRILNREDFRFRPHSYEGWLFTYNKTLLESLHYEVDVLNEQGLPYDLATWEDIFALSNQLKNEPFTFKGKKVSTLYPMTLKEPWQLYPLLTAGGWQFLQNDDLYEPIFDNEEFLDSLSFIEQLKNQYFDGNLNWRFELVLSEFIAPFGLTMPWMFVEEMEELHQVDFVFSAFPTYQKQQLTPLVKVRGLVALQNDFPSLTQEILRILNSEEVHNLMIEDTDLVLAIASDQWENYDMSKNRWQQSRAYIYSVSESLIALPNNPSMRAWDFYTDAPWLDVFKDMMSNEKAIEEVQNELNVMFQQWLMINNPDEDENED